MFNKKIIIISLLFLIISVGIFIFLKQRKFEGGVSIGDTMLEYGFVELQPPSTLAQPGTWVSVLNDNPLRLGVICTPENAIGLVDKAYILWI